MLLEGIEWLARLPEVYSKYFTAVFIFRNMQLKKREVIMKKIILALVIFVITSSPCLAEVATEDLFSVDGTQWRICRVGFSINIVNLFELISDCDPTLGFYDGTVYSEGGDWRGQISYINLGVLSIAYYIFNPILYGSLNYFLAIMQPIGLGIFTYIDFSPGGGYWGASPYFKYEIGIMFKVDDDWTPPEPPPKNWRK